MTITTDHDLLTVTEAAERLRVTTRFIRMLIAEGKLPALRIGRRSIRLRRDDIEDLLRPIERWSEG